MHGQRYTDFTEGNLRTKLLTYSWPLIVAQLLQMLYNTADTMVVGRYLGDAALGAVGSAGSITMIMLLLIQGAAQGASVVISQYLGASHEGNVKKTLMTSTYIVLILSLALGILGYFASPTFLRWINVTGEEHELATRYLKIMFAGNVATGLYNMGYTVSRSLGDSFTPMIILIFTSILNIVLNVLFVAGFHMGVEGVGYATIIATIIAAVICWTIIFIRSPIVRPDRNSIRPNWPIAKTVISVGIPSALGSSTNSIGAVLVQSMVNSFTTATLPVMAAYAAATKIESLVTYPMGGVSHAMQVLAGQNVGAEKYDRVGQGLKAALQIIVVYSVFAFLLLAIFGSAFMRLFTNQDATVAIGRNYLLVVAVFCIFNGIIYTLRFTLNGTGDAGFSAGLSVFELTVRIVGAYVLSHFTRLGYMGVFFGSPLGWILASIVATFRYRSGKWKEKRLVKS